MLLRYLAVGAAFAVIGEAQIAAVFSSVKQSSDCTSWSSWGNCIWLRDANGRSRGGYLDQLSQQCYNHWFFTATRRRFGTALNNFFSYLKDVTEDRQPCGMCSYRQSCGYGGNAQCEKTPWSVNRKVSPFYVAEQVCLRTELGGHQQNAACKVNYAAVEQNGVEGGTCQVWPSKIPNLSDLNPDIRELIYRLKWSNCTPDQVNKNFNGKPKYCRCCCFPFVPRKFGNDYRCVHMGRDKAPPAPGMERLREALTRN